MNGIDIIIILLLISSLVRGKEVGFVRQFFSTIGFFGGLLLGAFLQPHLVQETQAASTKSLITITVTLGCAFLLLTLGEYIGIVLKTKVSLKRVNVFDNMLGSLLAFFTVLIGAWLSAAIIQSFPTPGLQSAVKQSAILRYVNRQLPPAPPIIASLSHLIDPNGFPRVFLPGTEPRAPSNLPLPSLGELDPAVKKTRASVVKIDGQGCGGIVEGSGFVADKNLVITNAHVVAGIREPYVLDGSGSHAAKTVWFDPDLDIAVLRVSGLSGQPLSMVTGEVERGTAAAVVGYPGGGSFRAKPAAVLDTIIATGRNIYDQGKTNRTVYELNADIIQGNSGGPVIDKTGQVIGVVFAQSTTYEHVGYALTTDQVMSALGSAKTRNRSVDTGSCAKRTRAQRS